MPDKFDYCKRSFKKKAFASKASLADLKHPATGRRPLAYVTNQEGSSVSVVDILRSKKIKDIEVGKTPQDIDISPGRRYVYVSNFFDNTLSVIRTLDNRVVDTINLNTGGFTADGPTGVRVSKDGRFIYTANYYSKNMSVVDASQRRVIDTIPLPYNANLLDITKDGLLAYVTLIKRARAPEPDLVAVVDLSTNSFLKTIPVGTDPQGIAISPVRPLAYVANFDTNNVTAINTELAQPSPDNISVGEEPYGITFDPTGKRAFVSNFNQDNITVIDVFTHAPLLNISLDRGDLPVGVRVTPDGRFIITANFGSDTVSIIDARTYRVLSKVPAGRDPLLIAILDTCTG